MMLVQWQGAGLRRYRSACAMAIGLCASGAASAQVPPEGPGDSAMDMTQAVIAAVASHPSVRSAASRTLQAGEGIAAARAGYYPQVSAGVNSRLRSSRQDGYASRNTHQVGVTVSQMLYDFDKVGSGVAEAEAAVVAANARVLATVDDVVRETAQAWIEVRRYDALDDVAREQVKGVQALADLVRERHNKGAASRSDLVQAQSRVAAAQAKQLDTQGQAARWRQSLTLLTHRAAAVTAAGESIPAVANACLGPETPNLPAFPAAAVQVAQAEREVARAQLRKANAELKPTLSLDGSAYRGLSDRSRQAGQAVDWSMMVNFSTPLYEGGRLQARQRAATYAVETAEAAVAQAELNARQRLQDAQQQTRSHASLLPVLAQRVDITRETRDLYRQQYLQLGTRSLLDLLNAEQELHATRFEQVGSEHELQRLGVECLYQTGRLREAFRLDEARLVPAQVANR